MKDEKGFLYIFDAILAIVLLLLVVLVINSAISIPNPHYSESVKDFTTAQDTMEILSKKVNFTDQTFLADISQILIEGENSKESIDNVSEISKEKFKELNLNKYSFVETNILNGKILASSGDYNNAGNVSQASRSYGDYFYTLLVWE